MRLLTQATLYALLLGFLLAGPGPSAAAAVLEIPLSKQAGVSMVWIPAGSFTMGSPTAETGRGENESEVAVELTRGFYLAKTELTQKQWTALDPVNPSAFRGANLPVETITWDEARRFCERLNALHRGTGQVPAGFRWDLPTEAQWEFACRAGTGEALHHGKELTTADGVCPRLDEVAWYGGNAHGKTRPAGGRKPNAFGLYDMHGNVWEWCRDSYAPHLPGGRDPLVTTGAWHVRRGGSAGYRAHTCRSGSRNGLEPGAKGNGLGMRLALVPEGP